MNQEIYVIQKSKLSILDFDLALKNVIHPPHIFGDLYRILNFDFDEENQMFRYIGRSHEADNYFSFDKNLEQFSHIKLLENRNIQLILSNQNRTIDAPLSPSSHAHTEHEFLLLKNGNYVSLPNLVDACENDGTEPGEYEYISSLVSTNRPNELAFIASNATWGSSSVKIIRFDEVGQFVFLQTKDLGLEGATHDLAFNPAGDRFCLAEYFVHYIEDIVKEQVFIHEFSNKRTINKLNSFEATHGFLRFDNQSCMSYLNPDILCAVHHVEIVLYDMKTKEEIEIIPTDPKSAYCVGPGVLIYIWHDELKVRFY